MRTILTTVGTSLLGNTRYTLGKEIPSNHDLSAYLRNTTAEKACAETNSLSRLLEPDDHIILLHSDTPEGLQCASVLQNHFQYSRSPCSSNKIPHLTYRESKFKMKGLRSLVSTLVELILQEQGKGRKVLINATGGFKAEAAYATLVGLVFDVPVYYMHEAFKDIIEMPAMPISWDYSLIEECIDFLTWLDKELRSTKRVDSKLLKLPQNIRMLLVESEGYTYLSPAGEVLYMAYRAELSSAATIKFSKKAHQTYQAAPPNTKLSFDNLIAKLRLGTHRKSGSGRVHNSDCLVYPRDNRAERIFYYMEDNTVHICELAQHGSTYERLLDEGVHKVNYGEFTPFSITSPQTSR